MSFREVFDHAKQQRSDLVLLGGDLFHDNKPSRQTLFKGLQILNEYCLGPEPIAFQACSPPESSTSSSSLSECSCTERTYLLSAFSTSRCLPSRTRCCRSPAVHH